MSPVCQTAQNIVKLLISEFITRTVFIFELVHRRKIFKSLFQYKFITTILPEIYLHCVN